ncbi:hypothetical protein J0S82_005804 [Galemys pyrenaicus]|uniref:Uncharacterized protein n=1 Tax=Galemys pyrenaicus TaxID=202257 RepID=A0A8J6DX77_GALPY|nr:hypothetical protein J0S82_005804 [Galemys pyrenaicus]
MLLSATGSLKQEEQESRC